jgi:hypothetical protein
VSEELFPLFERLKSTLFLVVVILAFGLPVPANAMRAGGLLTITFLGITTLSEFGSAHGDKRAH